MARNSIRVKDFDYDKSPESLIPFEKDQDADSTDLSGFKAHGGKLILYNGWADHSTPPLPTVQYYSEIRQMNGEATDEFVRLFMMPGLYHCSGGPGPNIFGGLGQKEYKKNDPENDIIGALDRWVDQSIAPAKLIATKFKDDDPRQGVARTRLVCPYPQVATYKSSGSVDDAANFVCTSSQYLKQINDLVGFYSVFTGESMPSDFDKFWSGRRPLVAFHVFTIRRKCCKNPPSSRPQHG